jgi:SAM-dependent methyltransferase
MALHPKTPATFYDGPLYAALIEPFQHPLHQALLHLIPPGSTLLDACCGAGGFPLRAAAHCSRIVGVDSSPRQIAFAGRRLRGPGRRGLGHVTFLARDASSLPEIPTRSFDFATAVLALHEMPTASRLPVLSELSRVGRRVIVADFAVPPPGLPGFLARLVEMGAGPRHFAAYRDYCRSGGLPPLISAAGLSEISATTFGEGVLSIRVLESPRGTVLGGAGRVMC